MADFFYRENGRIIGPISGSNLRTLCQRKKITPKTEIRKGEGKWVEAGRVKDLAPFFESSVATKEPPKSAPLAPPVPPAPIVEESIPDWVGNVTQEIKAVEAPTGEQVVRRGRASFWRGYPVWSLGAFIITPIITMIITLTPLWMLAIPLLVLNLISAARLALVIYSMEYVITTERFTVKRGILTRNVVEVRHKDVRQLEVDQTLVQRMLGTGRIKVSSAAMSGFEIDIDGIAHPDALAAEIRKRQ